MGSRRRNAHMTMTFNTNTLSWLVYMTGLIAATTVRLGSSNIDQDKAECTNQLVGLASCLPYVGGTSKMPTIDCCTGLKQVLDKSKKCLCVLIRDKDDPSLGLTINGTLALGLPATCHTPTNITQCVDLLHLSPNSTEAKIFEVATKSNSSSGGTTAADVNSTTSGNGTSTVIKSHGGYRIIRMRRRWAPELVCGALILFLTSNIASGI